MKLDREKMLVGRALAFAREAHKGQKRKYTGEDYIVHPIEVATTVVRYGGTREMIVAALLHDVVEDTEVSLADIEHHFGDGVAHLVYALTDVSKQSDGNRATRKSIDREHLSRGSSEVKTIKLADLLSNTPSICKHDKKFAKVYLAEVELLLEVLTEGDKRLHERLSNLVKVEKQKLSEVACELLNSGMIEGIEL